MITEENSFLEKNIKESISCQKNLIFLKKEIDDSIRLLYQKIKKGGKKFFVGMEAQLLTHNILQQNF